MVFQLCLVILTVLLCAWTWHQGNKADFIGLTAILFAGFPALVSLVFALLSCLWFPFFWMALPFVAWVLFVLIFNRR